MKKVLSLLLALALVCTLAACGTEPTKQTAETDTTETRQEQSAEPASETTLFTDDCGRQVEIPAGIASIVPSGPLSQIILFAIAPEMLVGLSSKWTDSAEGIIGEAYYDLPVFGQLYGSADLNVEELAAAAPQLIIDVGEAKKSIVEDMDDLQNLTMIPSVHIEANLSNMGEVYRKLGALLGREEQGEKLAAFCERVYDRTQSIMEQVGDNKVNALYILGENGTNVLANGSYHAEMLDMLTDNLAVVENPAGKGSGNEVTLEQIALWNPDFILFAPDSIYDTAPDTDTWKDITAIANGDYVEVPEGPHNWMGSPPAVQRYLGLIWLTSVLYPDYCDYDVKAEILEYYSLFYGCDLTDAQYEALTANAFLTK